MNTMQVSKKNDNNVFHGRCKSCCERCIEKIDFLAGIPRNKQEMLMKLAVYEAHAKGDAIFMEEEPVDSIFIIHKGRVKLSAFDSEGREQIVGIFAEHDTIWEGVLMEGSRYPYAGICLTDVECCRIYRRDFEQAIREPEIALRVIGLLSKKLHDANQRNILLSTNSPKSRLAGFLLYRSRHSASDMVTLRLDDIAASISLRPETVSRKLRELDKEGLIQKTGQSTIRIMDVEALNKVYLTG